MRPCQPCQARPGPGAAPPGCGRGHRRGGGGGGEGVTFQPRGAKSCRSGCGRFSTTCRKLHPFGAQLIGTLLGIIC